MLTVKAAVEATFPDTRLYCVIALADISLYRQKALLLFCISFARKCNTTRALLCKSENLLAMGLDGEEHLRQARTVHSL